MVDEKTYDLRQSDLDQIAQANIKDVEDCFQPQYEKNKKTAGQFILSWTINSSGEAEGVAIKKADPLMKNVAACTAEKLKEWQFPALGGERSAKVQYPFNFKVQE